MKIDREGKIWVTFLALPAIATLVAAGWWRASHGRGKHPLKAHHDSAGHLAAAPPAAGHCHEHAPAHSALLHSAGGSHGTSHHRLGGSPHEEHTHEATHS